METKNEEKGAKKSAAAAAGSAFGALALAAASAAGGWMACEVWPKAQAEKREMVMPTVMVAVTNAHERTYNLPEQFIAHAESEKEVDLLPQVDGYIKEMKFGEGDIVKAGDVLYVIDDERYRAVVNQRKADLAAAEAEERRAQRYFDRMTKADARGITQLERDNAEAGAESSKAKVLQAKANLVVAEYDLKKTVVTAPISGQIGKSAAYPGDYVSPQKGALARIVQVDPIRVSFPMTDRAYVAWRQAQKGGGEKAAHRMRLVLADGSEYGHQGEWAFDDNTMSRETATIVMRLTFPNPDRMLVPNSYVTLLADYVEPPKFPSVPQQAVVDMQGGTQGVWVLKDDMTVELRRVELRDAYKGWAPLVSGVKTGERVVISGMTKLAPGMKVALTTPTGNDDLDPNYKAPVKE